MVAWRYYPVLKFNKHDKSPYIEVHEIYHNKGVVELYTANGMKPMGETKEELIHDLEMMLHDVKNQEPKTKKELLGLKIIK